MSDFLIFNSAPVEFELDSSKQLLVADKEVGTSIIIKGFASTSVIDRDKEVVKSPLEFDIKTFLNSPQLLLNHKYIKTIEGNEVAAGRILKAVPAYVKMEDPTDSQNWLVFSILDDKYISAWKKNKSPLLKQGDSGLFVTAEVYNEFAKSLVLKGEVAAFSWRGFAIKSLDPDGTKDLKYIDLVEISIVHTQNERGATFVITNSEDEVLNKDFDIENCDLYQMRFCKKEYSISQIEEFVKSFNVESSAITEDSSYIFINNEDSIDETYDSIPLKFGNSQIILKKKKNEVKNETEIRKNVEDVMSQTVEPVADIVVKTKIKEKLFLVDIERLKSQNPKVIISDVKKTLAIGDETEIDIHFIELPIEEVLTEKVETQAVAVEATAQAVENTAVEAVIETEVEKAEDLQEKEALKARLAELEKAIASMTESFKVNLEALTKQESEKAVERAKAEIVSEFEQKLENSKLVEQEINKQKQELEKKLKAFEGLMPEETVRSEKNDVKKNLEQPQEKDLKTVFANIIFGGK